MSTAIKSPSVTGRDHRVDFWRGIALAMIFINHIPGNLWENFTSRNFGFSDAAEIFVFLAGFASAYAYGRPFLAGRKLVAAVRAWRRAGVLYLVQITLSMAALGIFSWGALAFGRGDLLQTIGLSSFVQSPVETMIGLATLGHQFGYVNILPMYSVLLLMLPGFLVLARIDLRLMLGASVLLWVVAALFSLDMPAYPLPGGWFFNPFSWQLIFVLGLTCGFRRIRFGEATSYSPWLMGIALAYAFVAFLTIRFSLWSWWGDLGLPVMIAGFDKTYVSLPRLLHLVAILYIFSNPAKTSVFATISRDNLFAMVGRHSLPVFAVGTVLSLFGQVIKFGGEPSLVFDSALILGGLSVQIALARFLDWWTDYNRRLAEPAAVRPVTAASPAIPVAAPVTPRTA
ncbi:OpgC family protein [Aurantimonas sp. VKM B-3413]|uniref:OpgC family protein n=1 Tax=Aurantimonas sp. VKM B-3413 TaxID=2779401 RepID=UPI001E3CEDC0|nr:OpgC domain-containing protein [Aurantimonas sp. VKM B-3413]MCB8838670.1 OpgC domain-containing protein [Aurantimonas sp. VKM B-3413]